MSKDATSAEAALRLSIGPHEEQLETGLKELVHAAEARASVRHYVARYPWHFLFGGLMLGAWLGRRR